MSALRCALTMGPITRPVRTPPSISSVLLQAKSIPRRFCSASAATEKPPEITAVRYPRRWRNAQERLRAFGQGKARGQLVEDARVEPSEQGHALAQALVVVHLARHRPPGD